MFEKCGLRDIFCGFRRLKWAILCLAVIFACIGGVMYSRGLSDYRAAVSQKTEDRQVYAGYAYYYLSGKNGDILSAAEQKRYAKSYVDLMTAIPSRENILKQLLKTHEKEELAKLLDPVLYADGVSRNKLWEGSYYVETWSSQNILRVKTVAQTKTMCKELMKACRTRLESISGTTEDTVLAFEGEYYKKTSAGSVIMSDSTEQTSPVKPSVSKVLIWLAAGLFIGLLLSLILSILFPVLNRASDFEEYGVKPVGEVSPKTAALLARILDKMAGSEVKTVVFATSLKNEKKIKAFCASLCTEWNALGREVCLEGENPEGKTVLCVAAAPDQDAVQSDKCEKADLVIFTECKGISRHLRFDEMKHYLELLGIEPENAVLIA